MNLQQHEDRIQVLEKAVAKLSSQASGGSTAQKSGQPSTVAAAIAKAKEKNA